MNQINDRDDSLRAEALLTSNIARTEAWFLAGSDATVIKLSRTAIEFCVEWGRLIFSWCNESIGQSWKVSAYQISEGSIHLIARRGIAHPPTSLTLAPAIQDVALARSNYLNLIRRMSLRYDSSLVARSASVSRDRPRHLRGGYARLVFDSRRAPLLAIGVARSEDQGFIDGILAAGLVWVARFNEGRDTMARARDLWMLLPRNRAQTVIERMTLISTSCLGVRIRCFEVDEDMESMTPLEITSQMELLSVHPRKLRWPRRISEDTHLAMWRARIVAIAPDLIEVRSLIDGRGEQYLVNGLEFARSRIALRSQVFFGFDQRIRLTEDSFHLVAELVRQLVHFRRADSPDRRHDFYRLRAESWLESMLRRDIKGFDPTLDDRFVYSQIPTWRADERSVLDLLTVDRDGRLVVIEIKATEDAMLPLQGLDYWIRVEEARKQRQFERRGLFTGLVLKDQSPLLYLVTPRLRFHRTFSTVAGCIAPEVEAYRIGVNSNWRAGVRIASRERVNSNAGVTS